MTDQTREAYLRADKFILENNIKPLITKELIEEHWRKPIGKHSPELLKVQNYLRRHHEEIDGKFIIVCVEPHEKWCIGQHPGGRNPKYTVFSDELFHSREEAEHGLFLKRLQAYGLIDGNESSQKGDFT